MSERDEADYTQGFERTSLDGPDAGGYRKPSQAKATVTAPSFSPGPWHLTTHRTNTDVDYIAVEVTNGDGGRFDLMFEPAPDSQMIANCHLIAAAPDLYEALRVVADIINGDGGGPHDDAAGIVLFYGTERQTTLGKFVRAALAKAEGRTPTGGSPE